MADDGANFSVNTDDPTVTGSYLLGEYKFAKETLRVSERNLLISVSTVKPGYKNLMFVRPPVSKDHLSIMIMVYKDQLSIKNTCL